MKSTLAVLLFLLFACNNKPPLPENAASYAEALQLGKQLNRPILVDFMTDW